MRPGLPYFLNTSLSERTAMRTSLAVARRYMLPTLAGLLFIQWSVTSMGSSTDGFASVAAGCGDLASHDAFGTAVTTAAVATVSVATSGACDFADLGIEAATAAVTGTAGVAPLLETPISRPKSRTKLPPFVTAPCMHVAVIPFQFHRHPTRFEVRKSRPGFSSQSVCAFKVAPDTHRDRASGLANAITLTRRPLATPEKRWYQARVHTIYYRLVARLLEGASPLRLMAWAIHVRPRTL
jgi:hypothetical protein